MTTIAPEPKGSSRGKEILVFSFMGVFVLGVLLLPSFLFIYVTKANPQFGAFFDETVLQTKKELIDEIIPPPQIQDQNSFQPLYDAQDDAIEIKPETDIYTKNSASLSFASYPAECNVGSITGDYIQFNSTKCYSDIEILTLRGLFKGYFAPSSTEMQLARLESSILRIIGQGAPYPPVNN